MRRVGLDDEKNTNDEPEMPSVTAITTVIVAIATVYQLFSWYFNRNAPRPNTHQLAQVARFPIPSTVTRAMKFLRPADLQKLFFSSSISLGIAEFSLLSLNAVVSSVNKISTKSRESFNGRSITAIEARFEERFAALEKKCIEQENKYEEMLKQTEERNAHDIKLLEYLSKEEERFDRLRKRFDKIKEGFHKYWEKRDRILNEIQSNPEMMRRADALLWVLRARAKFIGNLADFFKGKLNDLPEDVKEAAEQLIEYNKRFRAEILPNPIDEILSNYYSEEELQSYRCPITLEVMMEPVKIVDDEGHQCHFERLALQRYYDTVTLDDVGDYTVPTRPDLPLIGRPENYPIDEKMRSRVRSLLERIIEEKPEIDEKMRSCIQNLLREMEEKSELAKAEEEDEFDAIIGSPKTYVRQYEMGAGVGESSSSLSLPPLPFSSPSLF